VIAITGIRDGYAHLGGRYHGLGARVESPPSGLLVDYLLRRRAEGN